jgi:bifunctional ADP-heptose synthase (sugar kinase/adenylyltransferase)
MNLIDLGKILRGEKVDPSDRVINGLTELAEIVAYLRQSGFRISATTGVWDLLHVGHCRYLAATREQGHISIIEVDDDEVVRARKPDNLHRPVVPMTERLEMLSYVRPVDLMYPLVSGEDPIEFIRVMHPDIFIVSETSADSKEDYLSKIRGHVGEVVILPAQAAISSTERIRRMMTSGAVEQLIVVRDQVNQMINSVRGNQ